MSKELELFGLGGLGGWLRRGHHTFVPEPGQVCANCAAELQGRFCHQCGQDADTRHRSIFHLIFEAFEGLFHLDSRLWKTLPPLFFQPGVLARDMLDGRMARHVPPFRIFLVALLVFMFAAEHKTEEARHHPHHAEATKSIVDIGFDAPKAAGESHSVHAQMPVSSTTSKSEDEVVDNVLVTGLGQVAEHQGNVTTVRNKDGSTTTTRNVSILAMSEDDAHFLAKSIEGSGMKPEWLKAALIKGLSNPERFFTILFTWGHRLALLLLPIIGLCLGALYSGKKYYRKFYLYDHLLVAMNMLSFVFFTNAIVFALPQTWAKPWGELISTVWTLANFFMTLRGAYGSSIFGAVLKSLFLWIMTGVAFLIVIGGVTMVALLQM